MVICQLNPAETRFLYQELFAEQTYLQHGIHLAEDACVFDVGANIGMFSLLVGQHCPRARLYAFEPIPAVAAVLRENLAVYGLDAQVFACGLGRTGGQADFSYYPHVSIISGRFADTAEKLQLEIGRSLIDEPLDDRLAHERFACELRTLSQIMREHDVERIDLLKINVEKSELDVLLGIDAADWPKIQQVVIAVHAQDDRLEQITDLLTRHGYELAIEQNQSFTGSDLYNIYAAHRHVWTNTRVAPKLDSSASRTIWSSEGRLTQDLRDTLRKRLPTYMIPSTFVLLDVLPLTANGKIDRRALPMPSQSQPSTAGQFVAPRTPLEQTLATVWSDVLKLPEIGVMDNFFELGGHSMLAMQVIYQIRRQLQIELYVHSIFTSPTIAGLATLIEQQQSERVGPHRPKIRPRPRGNKAFQQFLSKVDQLSEMKQGTRMSDTDGSNE
jgi:FkbM family methyltransferase